ncbi:MAG TPA: DUF2752 domain-containing protein [Phycisphaerales bacterium]|nr:DUF2752 domain-containing protein [Phycisphaerales bacterium]
MNGSVAESAWSKTAPPTRATTRSGSLRATRGERLVALGLALGILAVLVTAALLSPSGSGMGTHRQLGLPTCGWVAAMGVPCPTCGMTTAFASAAHMQPGRSFIAQPMGALLALVAATGFWGALHVAVFGSRLGTLVGRALRPRLLWVIAGIWCASWVYKVLVVRGG